MNYDKNNVFAKIIRGEIPCDEVYNDSNVLAFNDISPAAPIHVIVIPKGEYISFDDFTSNAPTDEVGNFFSTIQKIAEKLAINEEGYRIITNHGRNANQTVPHFHIHILAGKPLGGLLQGDTLNR